MACILAIFLSLERIFKVAVRICAGPYYFFTKLPGYRFVSRRREVTSPNSSTTPYSLFEDRFFTSSHQTYPIDRNLAHMGQKRPWQPTPRVIAQQREFCSPRKPRPSVFFASENGIYRVKLTL
jgi:hypothetical protein